MTPRALLLIGIGLLVTGLLIVLSIDTDPLSDPRPQGTPVEDYLSGACAMVGAGLVAVAALLSALRRAAPTEPPSIDHYS